jgi:hypothetical protein
MKGMYWEKLKVMSQTLWIQNVINFNRALVLPQLSLRDKKEKGEIAYKKEFWFIKVIDMVLQEGNNGKLYLNHLMIHYCQLQISF